jgi:IS6 family transposase
VTVYRWVQRFTPGFIEAARFCRQAPGDRWFADETYVKVAGRWTYLYRAIDQHGQVIDVLLSARRDLAAARWFFIRIRSSSARCARARYRPRSPPTAPRPARDS